MTTHFEPRNSASATVFPSWDLRLKSGAGVPMSGMDARIAEFRRRKLGQIDRVFLEVVQRAVVERAFMRRPQHDLRRHAGVQRLLPAGRAEAPAVAGLQARKAVLREGRREIVAGALGVGEELGGDDAADGVAADILGRGVAAAVAEESG